MVSMKGLRRPLQAVTAVVGVMAACGAASPSYAATADIDVFNVILVRPPSSSAYMEVSLRVHSLMAN